MYRLADDELAMTILSHFITLMLNDSLLIGLKHTECPFLSIIESGQH